MSSPVELPARQGPRVDDMLLEILRPALPGVTVVNLRDDDFTKKLPLIAIRAVAQGQNTRSGRTHGLLRFDIDRQCWAQTRRQAADLDDAAWRALHAARESGLIVAGGFLAAYDGGPGTELREPQQDGGLFRWQAGDTVAVRPAR